MARSEMGYIEKPSTSEQMHKHIRVLYELGELLCNVIKMVLLEPNGLLNRGCDFLVETLWSDVCELEG